MDGWLAGLNFAFTCLVKTYVYGVSLFLKVAIIVASYLEQPKRDVQLLWGSTGYR